MSKFRVALSGDFFEANGDPVFPQFDLGPLHDHSNIETVVLEPGPEITAEQVAGKLATWLA